MASIDLDLISRLARAGLAAGDLYAYCRTLPVLAAGPGDHGEWLLGYLRALAKLGLNEAAVDLIDRVILPRQDNPAVRDLGASLRQAPTGRYDWSSRRRRFNANLDALAQRDHELAQTVRDAWASSADRCELHRCSDGNYQVRWSGAPWPPRWMPFLDDHRSLAARRVDTTRRGLLPTALLFEGVGLGWEVQQGYAKTAKVFFEASAAIYIVEHHPEALAIALHLHDWRELLADPRLRWFVGPDAVSQFRELLIGDASWPLTDRHCAIGLISRPADRAPPTTVLVEVATRRQQTAERLHAEIGETYAGRDAAWWARRFDRAMDDRARAINQPLRILGLTSLHTSFLKHSMRDCLRALESLGHQTRLLIEPTPHQYLSPLTVLAAQADFEPDLILLLSRMRDETPGMLHAEVPSLSWDQDSLPWVFDPARRPQLAWNDFLMGYAASGARRRFGWPEHRCRYCSLAGSQHTYSADPLLEADLEPYRCDVSYVSHASATVDQEMTQVQGWLPSDRHRAIFRAAVSKLLPDWLAGGACPGPVMTAVLDAAVELGFGRLSVAELGELTPVVHRIAGRAFRHVALGWVADWADRAGRTFRIWGKGWDKHPSLARYARGPADNGHELRCIYQASRINLQLIGTGFFHQRALDGLMAGGFFMGRRSDADLVGPALRELMDLIEEHRIAAPDDLKALADVQSKQRILARLRLIGEDARTIGPEWIENRRLTAQADFIDERVPHFEDILFASPGEFAEKAERFLADDGLRTRLASEMRAVLVEHYSYDARMAEMLLFVRDGFRVEANLRDNPRQVVAAAIA